MLRDTPVITVTGLFQSSSRQLWFGRDVLGRRSLLYHLSSDTGQLSLSSVSLDPLRPWTELPAVGVYTVHFGDTCVSTRNDVLHEILCYPWMTPLGPPCAPGGGVSKGHVVDVADAVPVSGDTCLQDQDWGGVPMRWAQVGIIAPLGVFNTTLPGSLDEMSTGVAHSDHRGEEVDMTGHGCRWGGEGDVVSDHSRCPGDGTRSRVDTDSSVCQGRTETITASSASNSDSHVGREAPEGASVSLLKCATERQLGLSQKLLDVLSEAVRVRVQLQASRCHQCLAQDLREDRESDVALDRISLNTTDTSPDTSPAAETCELSNSAVSTHNSASNSDNTAHQTTVHLHDNPFEKQPPKEGTQKRPKNRSVLSSHQFDVPDRITGRDGLGQLNPDRCWNFVEIDVTLQELQEASIGCAIWFAARGRGLVTEATGKRVEYVSTARVVLVGMGADEQLAGYSRHRMKFQ
ncbi:hypothetical protein NP493_2g09055 [Ridgeia piscesae]|uniref:Uncharacterized protein n=1 Tax=Ridgeia piscesae TaxID=27915 RepID=A0AAD9PG10_RIDPI|nr:hypothetical protein NP493_2g09055 [Ridgeia piscesae]